MHPSGYAHEDMEDPRPLRPVTRTDRTIFAIFIIGLLGLVLLVEVICFLRELISSGQKAIRAGLITLGLKRRSVVNSFRDFRESGLAKRPIDKLAIIIAIALAAALILTIVFLQPHFVQRYQVWLD